MDGTRSRERSAAQAEGRAHRVVSSIGSAGSALEGTPVPLRGTNVTGTGTEVGTAPWQQRAAIDVPLHHPHRQDLLHEQWQRRLGQIAHVRGLRLPANRTDGVHRTRVERRPVGEVVVSR
jgi:hypothetical protein